MAFRIPELGSIKPVPLFEAPVRFESVTERVQVKTDAGVIVEGETLAHAESDEAFEKRLALYQQVKDIKLRVRLLDPSLRDGYENAIKRCAIEERARVHGLRRKQTEEENPEIYRRDFETEEGRKTLDGIKHQWLRDALAGIDGIEWGSGATFRQSDTIDDVEHLIKVLDALGWKTLAARTTHAAQYLTGAQSLS